MTEKGKLIVVSGPSGAGKTKTITGAMAKRGDICFSVSVTTRKPRQGEVDGKDYFFISEQEFLEMAERNELLEHAVYVGNRYGTPRAYVQQMLDEGKNVVLDIEVQGARQVHESMPDAVMIFLIPPSLEELKRRLTNRGTETEEKIQERLQRAREEYAETDIYQYIIINDQLEVAVDELCSIITANHCKIENRRNYLLQ